MKGYGRIADSLARFSILSNTFSSNSGFQETLAVFYADILEFHKHAYKFVRRKAWKLLFHTSWGRFQRRFGTILEDLKRHGDLIDLEANAHDISEARQMRQQLCTWRADSLERVRSLDEQQAAKQYKELLSWLKVDESEHVSIFDGIAEEGTRHPGTCGWILQHPKIRAWLTPQQQTDTRYIWLHGNPGSGKSVLAAQLVTYLLTTNYKVVRHFSTYRYPSSTKYESILRSILIQMVRGNEELIAHMYRECVLNKRLPSLSVLEQLVDVMLQGTCETPHQSRHIWVLIDGLDECESERQPRLLSLLNHMATHGGQESGAVCRVLVSSRKSPVIKKRLTKGAIVSLSDEAERPNLEAAIRNYASRRLHQLGEKIRELDLEPEELHEIECAIAKKSDGMFLYARLILDHLAANLFYTREEIIECVRTLPPKLADFYHEIMAQILSRLDSRSVDRLRCVFGWIAFSKRPLKRLQFLSALSFSSGSFGISRLVPHYILDACGPLVEERKDTCLSFVNVSVKEFFQSRASDLPLREHEILHEHGLATFACLLSSLGTFIDTSTCSGQTRSLRLVKGLHGFDVYATEFWTDYLLGEAAEGLDVSSPYFQLAQLLAARLEALVSVPVTPDEMNTPPDKRLDLIQQHEVLYGQVRRAIAARSLKQLQANLLQTDASSTQQASLPPEPKDGISVLLCKYQQAVEDLVNQESCPGASTEELELFKKTFRTSAYTCRLHSCPRATVGFESKVDRHDHEMGHAGGFRCTAPLCQYPPFPTEKSLKSHITICHGITPPPRSIRRLGQISEAPHKRLESSSSFRDGKTVLLARATTITGRVTRIQSPILEPPAPDRSQHRGMYSESPTATAQTLDNPPNSRSSTPTRIDLTSIIPLPPIATGMPGTLPRPMPRPMPLMTPIPPSGELVAVKCVCELNERREHDLVQCAICGTWQHASCYGLEHIPKEEPHTCLECSLYSERDLGDQIRQTSTYTVHQGRYFGQTDDMNTKKERQQRTLDPAAQWSCQLPENLIFRVCFPPSSKGACWLCEFSDPHSQCSVTEYRFHSYMGHNFHKCLNPDIYVDFKLFSEHLRKFHKATSLKWTEAEFLRLDLMEEVLGDVADVRPLPLPPTDGENIAIDQEVLRPGAVDKILPRGKRRVQDTAAQFNNTSDPPSLADQARPTSSIQDMGHFDDGSKRRKLAVHPQRWWCPVCEIGFEAIINLWFHLSEKHFTMQQIRSESVVNICRTCGLVVTHGRSDAVVLITRIFQGHLVQCTAGCLTAKPPGTSANEPSDSDNTHRHSLAGAPLSKTVRDSQTSKTPARPSFRKELQWDWEGMGYPNWEEQLRA